MAIFFEAVNPRHEHEWEVWREADLPEDKVLIPGLLGATTNFAGWGQISHSDTRSTDFRLQRN